MTQADEPRRDSIPGLAKRLIGGFVELAKLEITRGRQEMGEMLAEVKGGLVLIGIGVGLLVLALIAFVAFLILAIAALTGLPAWLVALIVFILLAALAALLGFQGVRRIKVGPPEETIEAVKEDIAWAKRLLKRG
jgi:membrane protein